MASVIALSMVTLFAVLWQADSEAILLYEAELDYGNLHDWENCSQGSFASAFEIKADGEEKPMRDNEGMTGIRLHCLDSSFKNREILSPFSISKGEWKGNNSCPDKAWLTGFRLRIESYQGVIKDDTGANNLEMMCSSGEELDGKGTSEGEWGDMKECPRGHAVCGVRVKVETKVITDRMGYTGLRMKCCDLSEKASGNGTRNVNSTNTNATTNATSSSGNSSSIGSAMNATANSTSGFINSTLGTFNNTRDAINNTISSANATISQFVNNTGSSVGNFVTDQLNKFNSSSEDDESDSGNKTLHFPDTDHPKTEIGEEPRT